MGFAGASVLAIVLLQVFIDSFGQTIELPGGNMNISVLELKSKNSGGDPTLNDPDEGYLRIKSPADSKGAHLALAASFIVDLGGKAAATELLSLAAAPAPKAASGSGQNSWTEALYPYLKYYGGRVFTEPINVYLIYYGTWTAKQKHIIENFIASFDRRVPYIKGEATVRGWWATTSRFYFDSKRTRVSSIVKLGGTLSDKYSKAPYGTPLNPLRRVDIRKIVANAIEPGTRGHFPADTNGAYFVLTSEDVYVTDFCAYPNGICAYHTSAPIHGTKIAYSFVGNPVKQCPMTCSYMYESIIWKGINDFGADAVVDHLAHELTEIATNPYHGPKDRPGWVVANSEIENADLCEYDYGIVRQDPPNYDSYNLVGKGGMKFMVQRNFNRRNFSCVLQGGD